MARRPEAVNPWPNESQIGYELTRIFSYLKATRSRGFGRGRAKLKVQAVGDSFKVELFSGNNPVPVTPELLKLVKDHRLKYNIYSNKQPWHTLELRYDGRPWTGYEVSKAHENRKRPDSLDFDESDLILDMATYDYQLADAPEWVQEYFAS